MKNAFLSLILVSFITMLSACAEQQGQNTYDEAEVGKQIDIEYGKILAVKHVKVQAQSSGVGTIGGAAVGGVGGSEVGGGKGAILTTIAGAIIGGFAGNAAEKALRDKIGIEYIIKKENGKTVSIVQNIAKDDKPFKVGQHVMIQTSGEYQKASGKSKTEQYQRVLPADDSREQ